MATFGFRKEILPGPTEKALWTNAFSNICCRKSSSFSRIIQDFWQSPCHSPIADTFPDPWHTSAMHSIPNSAFSVCKSSAFADGGTRLML